MSTFDGNNYYFSGQGVVMIGDRDSAGKPKGLIPVGNVSALKLGLAATTLEHKESQTGNRAIDLRLVTELKSSISMTIENFSKEGLASALAGGYTSQAAAIVTAEATKLYMGKVVALANIEATNVVVKQGVTALTLYTNSTTPWDYLLNATAGSIKFNDGTGGLAVDKLTTLSAVTAPASVTAGAETEFTWAATPPQSIIDAGVGGYFVVSGLAGTDAALVNNKPARITSINTSTKKVKIAITTTTITIGVPLIATDGLAIAIDYNAAAQNVVTAMTSLSTEKYMRFEGLNTADGGNPVVVEVFRFIVDPLKELALIGDGIGQFVLDGNVLADSLQVTGSKFFKVTLLR